MNRRYNPISPNDRELARCGGWGVGTHQARRRAIAGFAVDCLYIWCYKVSFGCLDRRYKLIRNCRIHPDRYAPFPPNMLYLLVIVEGLIDERQFSGKSYTDSPGFA